LQQQVKSKKKKSPPAKQVTAARQATKLPASLLSRHEIVALSGFTYPWIWQMMMRGQFPRSRIVGGEIDVAGVRNRRLARRSADPAIERRR
jgi:predicted DNA-binding transcriptional regulator AlpA